MEDAVAGLEVAEPEVDGAGGEDLVPLQQAAGTTTVTTQPLQLGFSSFDINVHQFHNIQREQGPFHVESAYQRFCTSRIYQDATKLIIDGSI